MKTAIVVPVKNEKHGLESLINTLLPQMAPHDELIFVDAGSTDGTREFLLSCAKTNEKIHFFTKSGATCGGGRNAGIRQTESEIIVHIDGGNIPTKNWLRKLCAPIIEGKADYVTGNISFMPIPKRILGIDIDMGEIYGLFLFHDFRRDMDGGMAGGSSVAYKKWIWEDVGGLPAWCGEGGEDVLFVEKIERLNIPARKTFVNDAIVFWQIGPHLRNVLKRKLQFQTDIFNSYKSVTELVKRCLIPSFLILSVVAGILVPDLRLPAAILLSLEWIRKGAKANRVFFREAKRKKYPVNRLILSTGILFFLEGLGLAARMCGFVMGLLSLEKSRKFREKARKYLSGEKGE